jgi:hypothetical protein
MANRFIVKPTLSLPMWPCGSEDEAMKKAAELFDEHGSGLSIEIFQDDVLLFGAQYMAKWNERRLKNRKSP